MRTAWSPPLCSILTLHADSATRQLRGAVTCGSVTTKQHAETRRHDDNGIIARKRAGDGHRAGLAILLRHAPSYRGPCTARSRLRRGMAVAGPPATASFGIA